MSRRFPCASLPGFGERVHLPPDTSHHVLRVVQVPRGECVTLFSPDGLEASAALVDVEDGRAVFEMLEAPRQQANPPPLVLVQGLPKKPAWERILRMATELGVTEIHGLVAERSVATGLHMERWQKILVGAAGQCGRSSPPLLSTHENLEKALSALPDGLSRRILVPGAGTGPGTTEGAVVLVGPEGGWTPEELDLAGNAGFVPTGLGDWTLRADTAVAAALAVYGPRPTSS
jgi:16S rRNA (uracil1498-N3)-methyltransferase